MGSSSEAGGVGTEAKPACRVGNCRELASNSRGHKKAFRAKVACLVKKKPFPSMRGATEHHHQGQSLQNGEIKIKRYRNYALEYFERFLEQGDSKRLARRMLWLCVE